MDPDSTRPDSEGNAAALESETTPWIDLGKFWARVIAALLRFPAFALFIALHYGADWALGKIMPEGMAGALLLARGAIFLIFLCVYVQLGIEVLAVFMPGIRPKTMSFALGPIKVEIGDGSNPQK
jgi:hypothetical protein